MAQNFNCQGVVVKAQHEGDVGLEKESMPESRSILLVCCNNGICRRLRVELFNNRREKSQSFTVLNSRRILLCCIEESLRLVRSHDFEKNGANKRRLYSAESYCLSVKSSADDVI